MRNIWKMALLGALYVVLAGESQCLKEKTVEFIVSGETIATFTADGDQNVDLGSDVVDLKQDPDQDLDIRQIANDYGVNPDSIRSVSFRGLFAKIETADAVASRAVTGDLHAQFGARPEVPIGSVTSFPAGAVTDWIDITSNVTADGVDEINRLLEDCLLEAQNGPQASDTIIAYRWAGTSTPTDQPTHFVWKVKVVINIVPTVTAELPDF
jgi:hypothetical protein